MPRAAEFLCVLTLIISDFYSITAPMLRSPLPFLLLFSCFYCHTAHTSSTQRQRGTDPAFREFRVSPFGPHLSYCPELLLARSPPTLIPIVEHRPTDMENRGGARKGAGRHSNAKRLAKEAGSSSGGGLGRLGELWEGSASKKQRREFQLRTSRLPHAGYEDSRTCSYD